MDAALAAPSSAPIAAPPFERILCGIDGSRSSYEAARQAAAVAVPGTRVELLSVSCESGYGPNAQAMLSHARAGEALHTAEEIAAKAGVEIVLTHRKGSSPPHVLLEEAAQHDLLVLGSHAVSRSGGIMLGSAVARAVHESQVPVLVARRAPSDAPFPTRILVGADGPGAPEAAIEISAQLARACGSRVTLLRVGGWHHHEHTRAVSDAEVDLVEATGVEPVELVVAGHPHRQLVVIGAREKASLIIVGSRGLSGVRALSSTSERVAHEADCSVLVLRRGAR